MKREKIIVWFLVIVVMLALVFMSAMTASRGTKTVKIGANLSLTGGMPYWSTQIKNGLDLALDRYREMGVEIVYEDNQGTPKGGLSAYHKLIQQRVCAIITAHTSIAVPQQPLADQFKVPLLGTVVGVSDFGEKNDWSFIDWPAHEDVVPPLVRFLTTKNACKKAAVLVVNDDYGRTGNEVFTKELRKSGGEVVVAETIANDEKNLRPVLAKILAKGIDCLYTIAREETLLSIIRQTREMGFAGYIVGDHAMASSVIDKGLSRDVEKIAFCGSAGIVEIEKTAPRFVALYKSKYGESPDWVALYGYSMAEYLLPIVKEAKGDEDMVRCLLSKVKLDTLRGHLDMGGNRKVNTTCVVYVRRGGRFVTVE